jgi:hypothetical protein
MLRARVAELEGTGEESAEDTDRTASPERAQ